MTDECNYTVYMHRLFDCRVYIGITGRDVSVRWYSGSGYSGQPRFYNAIKKYGWDAFEHVVLFEGLSREDAENMEIELIRKYRSTERGYGFNAANGGSCAGKLTEESKKKISIANSGKRASAETRVKMSAARKGRKQTPEHIMHRFESRKGYKMSEKQRREMGERVSKQRLGTKHSDSTKEKIRQNSPVKKRIYQFSTDNDFIALYDSLSDASRATGVSVQNISNMAQGRYKTAGGYVWQYVNEVVT